MLKRIKRMLHRTIKKYSRLLIAKSKGLNFAEPNFLYLPLQNTNSLVIDVGCGFEADFSRLMIEKYKATAYAVDPTRKHQSTLKKLVSQYNGSLHYLPYAVCAFDGELEFHESKINESGSILTDHINIKRDSIESYNVKAVTLKTLIDELRYEFVDILKLDIEGAEYELLKRVQKRDLLPFQQIFIEFHHHAISQYTESDTANLVRKIQNFGFNSFSLDDHNFIFWQ